MEDEKSESNNAEGEPPQEDEDGEQPQQQEDSKMEDTKDNSADNELISEDYESDEEGEPLSIRNSNYFCSRAIAHLSDTEKDGVDAYFEAIGATTQWDMDFIMTRICEQETKAVFIAKEYFSPLTIAWEAFRDLNMKRPAGHLRLTGIQAAIINRCKMEGCLMEKEVGERVYESVMARAGSWFEEKYDELKERVQFVLRKSRMNRSEERKF